MHRKIVSPHRHDGVLGHPRWAFVMGILGMVNPIDVLFGFGNPARVKHVLVHARTQGRLLLAEAFLGQGPAAHRFGKGVHRVQQPGSPFQRRSAISSSRFGKIENVIEMIRNKR